MTTFPASKSDLKTTNTTGPKITVNDKSGTLTLSIKSADLQNVLDGLGASNDDISGVEVRSENHQHPRPEDHGERQVWTSDAVDQVRRPAERAGRIGREQ